MFMFTKTGSNLTYHEYSYTSVHLTIQSLGLTRLHDKLKTLYPTTALSLTSKLCRFVTYLEGLLPIKTHEPLTTWSREFMRQTRTVISLYLHYHMPINTKLWRVVTYLERVLPKKTSNEQIITLSCKISRLKTLHLYYCNAYDKQTWQEASTHKVIWPFDQVVLWSNVKIKYVIFALPQGSGPPSIAQGLRGCYKGFSPIKSHNPITTWPQGMRSFYQ